MADRCRFPVFFEAPGLDETQRKRIQNYFRITSKSGGGESSNLTNISNCLFTISFQEQKGENDHCFLLPLFVCLCVFDRPV